MGPEHLWTLVSGAGPPWMLRDNYIYMKELFKTRQEFQKLLHKN